MRTEVQDKYRRIIASYARRFARPGNAFMNVEDLEAEGWLTFVKVMRAQYGDHLQIFDCLSDDFESLFRTSLRNRYVELWRRITRPIETNTVVIDLSEIHARVSPSQINYVYMREMLLHAQETMSPEAWTLAQVLLFPPKEVWKEVVASHVRSRHLVRRGIGKTVRRLVLSPRAIAKAIQMPMKTFDTLMEEIALTVFGREVPYENT